MKQVFFFMFLVCSLLIVGCASTVAEKGASFNYHNEVKITPGISKKGALVDVYGEPTETKIMGKYQVYRYYYGRESIKHGRAIGQEVLSSLTMGIAGLMVDHYNGPHNLNQLLSYIEKAKS